jgi:hypothetical protein
MTEPTKIVTFRKSDHRIPLRLSPMDAGGFPRFRKEWNRPTPPPPPPVHTPAPRS